MSNRDRRAGRGWRDARRSGWRPRGEWDYPPEPLWWGADDYELLIDIERGVTLRLAARGRAFDVTEVLEVASDETVPTGTFVLHFSEVKFDGPERLMLGTGCGRTRGRRCKAGGPPGEPAYRRPEIRPATDSNAAFSAASSNGSSSKESSA